MHGVVRSPVFKIVLKINVVVGICFALGKAFKSLGTSIGKASFKIFGLTIPYGKLLGAPFQLISIPCNFIGDNIKIILIADVILIIILFLMSFIKRRKVRKEQPEELGSRKSEFMDSFGSKEEKKLEGEQ